MKKRKITLADVGMVVGIVLVVASAAMLILSQRNQKLAASQAEEITEVLYTLMPDVQTAAPDDRSNILMPAVEIEADSFCGILEFPRYEAKLPVCESWRKNKVSKFPFRYLGTLYDGSLVIGCSDNEGQLDFINQIEFDDNIYVTDMAGDQYSFAVKDIQRTKDVSANKLMELEADLLVFAKNTLSLDYTIVLCEFASVNK